MCAAGMLMWGEARAAMALLLCALFDLVRPNADRNAVGMVWLAGMIELTAPHVQPIKMKRWRLAGSRCLQVLPVLMLLNNILGYVVDRISALDHVRMNVTALR